MSKHGPVGSAERSAERTIRFDVKTSYETRPPRDRSAFKRGETGLGNLGETARPPPTVNYSIHHSATFAVSSDLCVFSVGHQRKIFTSFRSHIFENFYCRVSAFARNMCLQFRRLRENVYPSRHVYDESKT